MRGLGDGNSHMDVRQDEMSQDITFLSRDFTAPLDGGESTMGGIYGTASSNLGSTNQSQLDQTNKGYVYNEQALNQLSPDNVEIAKAPLLQAGFLVSFMVDARGGAMRGCRHSGVRVIIPPKTAQMPMRITCRYLRMDKLIHPPRLNDGEACASKIMEVGPAGAKFLGPVLIEVPHFASLRGREREIIILSSDDGETWREHPVEVDEKIVQSIIKQANQADSRDKENDENRPLEDSNGSQRITKIITDEFPHYFAIISRVRREVHAVGPDGAIINSTVVPRVQATFTEGALTKRIKVDIQAQAIPNASTVKLFGQNRVSFSPIVTIEPRRRKFHCPIQIKIPLPPSGGSLNADGTGLRLLCSITGGTNKAQWEDVTGSTPLAIVEDCLLFTTTVSARFWLVDCKSGQASLDSTKYATELYDHIIRVPYMAKFVIFAKRRDINEANVRVFCMTDDREDKTLELQEHFTEVAKSRDVEIVDGQPLYLEFAGNLWPTLLIKSNLANSDQLGLRFRPFRENRLAFVVRIKDIGQDAIGRIAFMEESIRMIAQLQKHQNAASRGGFKSKAICNLNILLPGMCVSHDEILGTPKRNSHLAMAKIGDLTLADIANELDDADDSLAGVQDAQDTLEWVELAPKLGIPRDEVEFIQNSYEQNTLGRGENRSLTPALIMLMHWYRLSSPLTRNQDLGRALLSIGRSDIARKLNFFIEPRKITRSTMELLREIELIPVKSSDNLYGVHHQSPYNVDMDTPTPIYTTKLDRNLNIRSSSRSSNSARESSSSVRTRTKSESGATHKQGGPPINNNNNTTSSPTIKRVSNASLNQQGPDNHRGNQEESIAANMSHPGGMEAKVNTKEWTQEDGQGVYHIVEQTATLESKPTKHRAKSSRLKSSGRDGSR